MIDDRLREELNALVDGELAEERAAELRAQLDTDAALQAEFDRMRRVADLVRSLPMERANVADEVMARLPRARGIVHRPWAWGGALAAAAAAVVLGVTLWHEQPPPERYTEAREPKSEELERKPERAASEKKGQKKGLAALREEPVDRRQSVKRLETTDAVGRDKAERAEEEFDDEAEAKGSPRPDESRARRAVTTRGGNLLQRVESKGAVLNPAQRTMYLRMLAGLTDQNLGAHLQRVSRGSTLPRPPAGPTAGSTFSSKEKARKKSEPAWSFDLTVANAEEATAVRKTLERAFRPQMPIKKQDAGKVRPNAVSSQSLDKSGGVLRYDWIATPQQAGMLVVWLDRIGLGTLGKKSAVRPSGIRISGPAAPTGGLAGGDADEEQPSVPVRLRIHYGTGSPNTVPPKTPTNRSDDD